MLIGWNGETMPALPIEEELPLARFVGYEGIELFLPKLTPFLEHHGPAGLAAQLKQAGLIPLSLNGIERISFRPPDEFAQLLVECRKLAELAQQIGCSTIVVVPSPLPAGLSWPQVRNETVSVLRALADTARPYGIQIGFEFLAPADCSVRTLAQGWELVQAAQRKNLGLILDSYHFWVGGSSWESLEAVPVERLLLVHINDVEDLPHDQLTDAHRLLPGEGILPLDRILTCLHERGYDGGYSLEVMRPSYMLRAPQEYMRAGYEAVAMVLAEAAGA
jgi:2-keto-myo-inositol isomerase